MSFCTITGTMGGGKSMMAAGLIRDALLKGRKVYTNVAMLPDQMEKQGIPLFVMVGEERVQLFNPLPKDFSLWADMIEYAQEGNENLIIIEEAGEYFFVGKKDNKAIKEELYLLIKDSRHKGLAMWFIEQNFDNLDVQLRRMAQHEYYCTALKDMPLIGPIAVLLKGDFKRAVHAGGSSKEMTATYHRFDNSLAVIYKTDSRAPAEFQKPAGVVVRQRGKMTFATWALLLLFTVVPVVMLYMGHLLYKRITGKDKQSTEQVAVAGAPAPAPAQSPTASSPASPVASSPLLPALYNPQASEPSAPEIESIELFGHPVRKDRMYSLHFVEPGTLNLHTSVGIVTPDGLIDGFPVVSIHRYGPQCYLVLDAQPAWHFVRTVNKPIEKQKPWNTFPPASSSQLAVTSQSGAPASLGRILPASSGQRGAVTTDKPVLKDGDGNTYVTPEEYRDAKDKSAFRHRGTDIIKLKAY